MKQIGVARKALNLLFIDLMFGAKLFSITFLFHCVYSERQAAALSVVGSGGAGNRREFGFAVSQKHVQTPAPCGPNCVTLIRMIQ